MVEEILNVVCSVRVGAAHPCWIEAHAVQVKIVCLHHFYYVVNFACARWVAC